MAWGLSVLLVIACSSAQCGCLFARKRWWGYPVMILGAGKTGSMVIRTLKRRPGTGLRPVLVLDDDPQEARNAAWRAGGGRRRAGSWSGQNPQIPLCDRRHARSAARTGC